jgi:hypothetical protein
MLCISSFMIQSFLLFLGIFDPNFQRVVFWCFYAVAVLMQRTALRLEGFYLCDPVSRFLEALRHRFGPFCGKLWGWITKTRDYLSLCDWPEAVLAFFTVTFFFYRDFGHRMIFGYALLGLLLAIHLLRRLKRDEALDTSGVSLGAWVLGLVILFHFLLPGARHDADTFSYQISMILCLGYAICAQAKRERLLRADRVMYLGAMAMAAFVIVFFGHYPAYCVRADRGNGQNAVLGARFLHAVCVIRDRVIAGRVVELVGAGGLGGA